jgi:hypothetical protein
MKKLILLLLLISCVSQRTTIRDNLIDSFYSYGDLAYFILEVPTIEDAETIKANYNNAIAYNDYFTNPDYNSYFFEIDPEDLNLKTESGTYVIPDKFINNNSIAVYIDKSIATHNRVINTGRGVLKKPSKVN